MCAHADCLTDNTSSPAFYPTWTALQHHIRTAHPPICVHPNCNRKTFKSQKGLRAHLRLHDEDAVEELAKDESDEGTDLDEPPPKKLRGGHVGRDWVCDVEGCGKDFKSVSLVRVPYNMYSRVIPRKKR